MIKRIECRVIDSGRPAAQPADVAGGRIQSIEKPEAQSGFLRYEFVRRQSGRLRKRKTNCPYQAAEQDQSGPRAGRRIDVLA